MVFDGVVGAGKGASCPKLVLAIVFLALLLDNILLTVVVPIVPDYLIELRFETEQADLLSYIWNDTALNLTHFNSLLYNVSGDFAWHNGSGNPAGHDAGFPIVPEQASDENSRVGWLFSSKAIVQLIANPFIGPVTNRYGSHLPMFIGFIILTVSTILYAFGESYEVLFLARAIHGLSSSCTSIAGMTMLADTYTEDKDRSKAMGIALGGLALGVLIGYPFGGFMYQFVGKMALFLVIAFLVLCEGVLQLWVLQPSTKAEHPVTGTPLYILLRDPYILIASGAILFPEMAMAMLEPTLPIWLIDKMDPAMWQLGTVFVPDSVGYLIGTNAFGFVAYKLGRWACTMASLLLMGVCLICIPFATRMVHLIVPHFGLGLALGIVDVSIMPLLALLVDNRHVAVYGTVYAIAQFSISLGFAIGPSLGGQFVKLVGFPWLMRGMAIANLVYAPLCYFLRDPPSREENKSILMNDHSHLNYTEEENFNYRRLDDD